MGRYKGKIDDDVLLEMMAQGKSGVEIARHFGCSSAAVSKKFINLKRKRLPLSFKSLTTKQQKFCLEVAAGKSRKEAALTSYDCSTLGGARSIGNELMKEPNIKIAISDLMAQSGINRKFRIRKLGEHINHKDPTISLKALDQSWRLDNLYNDQPINAGLSFTQLIVQGTQKTIDNMEPEKSEELEAEKREKIINV